MKTRELLLIATVSTLLLGGCIWQADGNAAAQKNTISSVAVADTQQAVSLKTRIIRGTIIDIVDNKDAKMFYLATALPHGKPYITAIVSSGRLMVEMKIGDQVEVTTETGGLENNLVQCRFIKKVLNLD